MKTEQVDGWEYWLNVAMALTGIAIMAGNNFKFMIGLWIFSHAKHWARDIKKRENK